jgi:hypothetical protein
MSKTPPKKRKTRLKGTETKKPCFDCGKTKDRFKDFKPRWAGCVTHRTPNGRRFYQKGCADCDKLVNGNIRQPRCVDCDKMRPKKRNAKKAATPTPTPVATTPEPVAVIEPTPEPVAVIEPEPVAVIEPEPEPETVAEVVGQPEPSPESVKLPEPEAPKAKPKPIATSAADIFAMLEDADNE